MPTPASTCRAVFLSYAREDTDAARRIADALRAFGVEVWFDQNELRGGDAWDAKIKKQIRECTLFLPIVSANTQARGEGYFRREWKLGVERTHDMSASRAFIVPVVIDETPEAHAEVPEEFMRVQWTRLAQGVPSAQFVEQIKRLLAPAPATNSGSREAFADRTETLTRSAASKHFPAWTWAAGAAALAVALIGVVAFFATRKAEPRATPAPAFFSVSPSPSAAKLPADSAAAAKSIAVLPFVNLGADKGDEYLGDGITEELLNALCKIKGLRVPGRSSCFAFKGKTGDTIFREVGEKLGVSTVLEGSVRRVGERIRITAQLINVADGFHLWSENYDGDMKDILAVQTAVAQKVVQALQLRLGGDQARALAKKPTDNPEAHRLYLLGRFHFAKLAPVNLAEANRCFTQAIELDPGYALAYCGLADVYSWVPDDGAPGRIAWARQREVAEKALALDPTLADAHLSLGLALADAFRWELGEESIRQALELNPNLALAYDQLGWLYVTLGRYDEALAETRRALELDPLSPLINAEYAVWLMRAGRYGEAVKQAGKALELNPDSGVAYRAIGWSRFWSDDRIGAIEALEKVAALENTARRRADLAFAYSATGDRMKAERILRELERASTERYIPPGALAVAHLSLGDRPRAIDWLEKAYADQDDVCWRLKCDRIFDSLRHEPRFQALLKKVGLEK